MKVKNEVKELKGKVGYLGSELQGVIDVLPYYIVLVDENHNIVMANKALEDLLGKGKEDIIGKFCPKVVHGLDEPFPGCPLEEAVEKDKAIIKEFHDDTNGRWIRSEIYPTELRSLEGSRIFFHTALDITESKCTKEEVKRTRDTQHVINAFLSLALNDISLNELLKQVLDLIISIPWLVLEEKGGIFLVEDDLEVLVMKAQKGLPETLKAECAKTPFGKCLCGRAAKLQKLVFADCIDDRHEVRYDGISAHGHYCVPILYEGKTLGVINTYIKEGHHRSQKDEDFLTAIANALAGVIKSRRVEEENERNRDVQTVINSILHQSLRDMSVDEIFNRTLELVVSMPRFDFQSKACIFLIEHNQNVLVMQYEIGLDESIIEDCAEVPIDTCICGQVAKTRKTQFCNHAVVCHERGSKNVADHGHYCVPISHHDKLLGLMNVYVNPGVYYSKVAEEFITVIAQILATVVEHKISIDEIKRMNKIMVGRELRMVELKKKITRLEKKRKES